MQLRLARRPLIQLLPLLGVLLLVSLITAPAHPTGDEGPLIGAAHRLLHGRYAVPGAMDATKFLWHGPGLPALLAPLLALKVPLGVLRLTSPLLMFAAALLFYRLLRLRLSRRTALIGAYALGLYAPAYYVLGTVAKDPLALLLAVVALDGTARYLSYGQRRHALIAGAALGALVMTRLEYGWVITVALTAALAWWGVGAVRARWGSQVSAVARRSAVVCGLGLVACIPWLTYTYTLTHHLFYWGNSGGLSLYWMSSLSMSQLGEWYAPHTVMADPALAAYRPFFHYLATLRPVQRDLELQHVAIAHALGHPAKYALNLLANLGRAFVGYPFSFMLPVSLIVGLCIINGGLLAGLVAATRSLRRSRLPLPRETVPFLAFGAIGLVAHLLPTSEPRMVLPVIPVAIWLIAWTFGRRRGRRTQTEPAGPPLALPAESRPREVALRAARELGPGRVLGPGRTRPSGAEYS